MTPNEKNGWKFKKQPFVNFDAGLAIGLFVIIFVVAGALSAL
jgi:hypothetical protein